MSGTTPVLGAPLERREAVEKVTGAARYALDRMPERCAYAWPVPAGIARGRVVAVDTADALAVPGVLHVLTHEDAPRVEPADDPILNVLQDDRVPHRGWYVALVVAESPEAAALGAAAVHPHYDVDSVDVQLTEGHPALHVPEEANGGYPGARERGEFDAAFASSAVRHEATYRMTPLHNHPMEPHAATAHWKDGALFLHSSSQGTTKAAAVLGKMFGLGRDRITVTAEHVGGGFGSKGTPRPEAVLAAMAARICERPVKLGLPRRELPNVVGHRAPTVQRVRLGAREDGTVEALSHEVFTHTSTLVEFTEQAAVPARVMYRSPHSRTVHKVAALHVPTPSWMRAPGEAPGMYALESAMDELAVAAGVDPVELRLRNDTDTEPDSGKPFSSRGLAQCLREGAARFGWGDRDPKPRARREGDLLIGTGVASSAYPVLLAPSKARAHAAPDGSFTVEINATDIGTGARTVLSQVAAEALAADPARVRMRLGNSTLPSATLAGGSMGTGSWGWAVHEACTELAAALKRHEGPLPAEGLSASADTAGRADAESDYARHAFGAQFAEVAVDNVTGEVRVRRMTGVFACGRILNSRTARSQFTGGMVMGIGMALTEHSALDATYGGFTGCDLAGYHVPANADIPDIEAHWIDEDDPHLNPMGSKGIGEIGVVGTAAAVTNAVFHATGVRVRDLPVTPDRLLGRLG